MLKRLAIISCAWAAVLMAQTTVTGSRTIVGAWDASGAQSTKPHQMGSALPATCSAGQTYFLTTAVAGQNLYICQPANTWIVIGSGGGGSSATSYAVVFNGSTTTLADGSTVTWSCGSGAAATCTTSWTVPAGVNAVRVVAWSGGQGGSGSVSGGGSWLGGGGGGSFTGMCPVTPGNSYTVTVGLGGAGSVNGTVGASGGSSGFGSCFTLIGGGQTGQNFGGYLSTVPVNYWGWIASSGNIITSTTYCTYGGAQGSPGNAVRSDGGGCGAMSITTNGTAGMSGGSAIFGGGGGGSGAYNNANGGAGGASGTGGTGGNGGGWTSAGGLVACTAGTIPGGGGGGAAGTTSGNGNQTGCAGARGEVRIYYTK